MAQEGLDKGMITLRELAAAPATVVAGQGSVFVLNSTPSSLAFVGDDNAQHGVLTSGVAVLMSGQCNASGSYIGQYQASGLYLDSSQVFLSGVAGMSGDWVGKYVVSGTTAFQASGSYVASGDIATLSGGVVGVVSGMGLVTGGIKPYAEIFGGNLGDGLVYNYVQGVNSGMTCDLTSGRIALITEGDYFVGFQAQLTATSGGATTDLSIRKNNTLISGTVQRVVSPGLVTNFSYCQGTTQSCLVHGVSGDYLTAHQDEVAGDWTISYAKLYAFQR